MSETTPIEMFDVVVLVEDLPEHGLHKGDKGTLVDILSGGALLFDFSEEDLCLPVLRPEQFRLYWRAATRTYVSPRDALLERIRELTDAEVTATLSFIDQLQAQREPAA